MRWSGQACIKVTACLICLPAQPACLPAYPPACLLMYGLAQWCRTETTTGQGTRGTRKRSASLRSPHRAPPAEALLVPRSPALRLLLLLQASGGQPVGAGTVGRHVPVPGGGPARSFAGVWQASVWACARVSVCAFKLSVPVYACHECATACTQA